MNTFRFNILSSRLVEDRSEKTKLIAVKTDQNFDVNHSNPPREKGKGIYILLSPLLVEKLANDEDLVASGHVSLVDLSEMRNNEETKSLEKRYQVLK